MSAGGRREIRWHLGYLTGQGEHFQAAHCVGMGCGYIVEEHQAWGKPETADVPEFTIEVAWKDRDHTGRAVSPGYRYIVKWKENGLSRQLRNYGFANKDQALDEAKEQATSIARQLTPVHVETFTPNI
jgi:hypothetical protein